MEIPKKLQENVKNPKKLQNEKIPKTRTKKFNLKKHI